MSELVSGGREGLAVKAVGGVCEREREWGGGLILLQLYTILEKKINVTFTSDFLSLQSSLYGV